MIEEGLSIAQASLCPSRNPIQRIATDVNAFLLGNLALTLGNFGTCDFTEIEPLTAGENGARNLLCLGRREDEHHLGRGFFKRFQQSVEGMLGEHMHFIDDIDLVAATCGGIANFFTQVADLINPTVRGPIDLQNVQ